MPPVFVSVPTKVQGIIRAVIAREGGFVDHPSDPGRATKFGITLATLTHWRGVKTTVDDVRSLTTDEAMQIYYQEYWLKLNMSPHIADPWIREFMFDWCVNGGLRNPVRTLQRLLQVRPDGFIGPVTGERIEKWKRMYGHLAHGYLVDTRIRWYIRIAESRHSSITFLGGWFNRANTMRYIGEPYSNR